MRKILIGLMFAVAIIWGMFAPKIQKVRAQAPGSGCPSSTAFGSIACSLATNSWQEVTGSSMTGWSSGQFFQPPDGGSSTEYTDKAMWNPISGAIEFLGGSHCNGTGCSTTCGETLFVSYTDSSSTFAPITPSPCPTYAMSYSPTNWGHTYNDIALDPATGNFFIRQPNGTEVAEFSQSTQAWSFITNISTLTSSVQVDGGLEWFPDRNSLVVTDGYIGVAECVFSGSNSNGTPCSTWVQKACISFSGCSNYFPTLNGDEYDQHAKYSVLCHCVWIGGGGGSTGYVLYYANGTFSSVGTVPFSLGYNYNVWAVDPASGRFLVFEGTSCTKYVMDPTLAIGSQFSTWSTSLPSPLCPTSVSSGGESVANVIVAPIPGYNALAYIYVDSANGSTDNHVYLYKYTTPGTGDYIQRSEQPGVLVANPLATSGNINYHDQNYGYNYGSTCNSPGCVADGAYVMSADSSNYPGNDGSMICTIPVSASGYNPCSVFYQNFGPTNGSVPDFTDATACASDPNCLGQTFHVQLGMWMDTALWNEKSPGGEGIKQFIISNPDPSGCTSSNQTACQGSCSDNELVLIDQSYRGMTVAGIPQLYTSCYAYVQIAPSQTSGWDSSNYLIQTGSDTTSPADCFLYPQLGYPSYSGSTGSQFFSPNQGCIGYPLAQWFSVELDVTIGTYSTSCPAAPGSGTTNCWNGNTITGWIAPLGQAYKQWFSTTFNNWYNNSHEPIGKINIVPTYNTGATTWTGGENVREAELIVSTNSIAAPAVPADSGSPTSYVGTSLGINLQIKSGVQVQ